MAKAKAKKATTKRAVPPSNSQRTDIMFVLDESGSMQSQQDAVIEGLNAFFEQLKKDKTDDCTVSLVKFDTTSRKWLFKNESLERIPTLTAKDYKPLAGTPLYDAIMEAAAEFKVSSIGTDRRLFCIYTDGEENSSQKYKLEDVQRLVKDMKETWTFTFLGANIDAYAAGTSLGINASNIGQTRHGSVRNSMSALASATNSFRASGVSGQSISGYYNAEEQVLMNAPDAEEVTTTTTTTRINRKRNAQSPTHKT